MPVKKKAGNDTLIEPAEALEIPEADGSGDAVEAEPPFDWAAFVRTPAFMAGSVLVVGLIALFWPLLQTLPSLWMGDDGYYSHGFLVPFISGYVIHKNWPAIRATPVRAGWYGLILLVPSLFFTLISIRTDVRVAFSVFFVLTLIGSIWFVLGAKILIKTWIPTVYLLFALPIWSMAIDAWTNPLQVISTDAAMAILKLVDALGLSNLGAHREASDPTVIYLNNFILDVGIPCSGFKLLLALCAFTVFFVMIGGLKWWANLIMLIPVPLGLGLFINGLRISLIGMVGNAFGADAGHTFHDYSGYLTLFVCFFILFWIARKLGWKRDTEPLA